MDKVKLKKVSVIIPIYNIQKYIDRCILSVINQTYSNIEIILVNDGSIDNSGKICDNYSKIDNRITVIHKKNGGLSSARNSGLDIASGDYILFVDGDDYIHESAIEILIEKAITNNADIVHFNFNAVDEDGNQIKIKNKDLDDNKILDSYQTLYSYIKEYKVKVMSWSKLYKAELFKNLRFDEGYVYEDELIFPKVVSNSVINYTINDKLYYYVQAPNSITKSSLTENKVESKKYLINFWEKFYIDKYPELIKYVYIAICFICVGTIKEIKKSNQFSKEYKIQIYPNIYNYKKEKLDINKKEIFCWIIYKILKFKVKYLNKK